MTALLMEFSSRRILRAEGNTGIALAPGSTLKPIVIAAAMQAKDSFVCPIHLSIAGRQFSCSHPRVAAPITVATAIAYSCNNFVAHVAARLPLGDLARHLIHSGFPANRVRPARTIEEQQLQALGDWGILTRPHDLLFAYHRLAAHCESEILEGLEGAVEYGTAQLARVAGVTVAGKTGTAGGNAAWFAGWAPSRAPKYVAVILTPGKSGGQDAAPLAARLFSEFLRKADPQVRAESPGSAIK